VSAAHLENLLARLYTDAPFRRTFLSDPAGVARSHGLAESEVEALRSIDRGGLELAARSFAHKRATHGGAGRRRSWFARLIARTERL
jgi:hypothetical protein